MTRISTFSNPFTSSATGTGWSGTVNTFANLPAANSVDADTVYLVKNSQGTWILGTKKVAGFYISDGISTWTYVADVSTFLRTDATTSTENAIPRYDTTNGVRIKTSSVLIDDSDNMTGVNDITADGNILTNERLFLGTTANYIREFGGLMQMVIANTQVLRMGANFFDITSNTVIIGSAKDVGLERDSANVLKITDGSTGSGAIVDLNLVDSVDITKKLVIDNSSITTSTTRTLTSPDFDLDLNQVKPNIGGNSTFIGLNSGINDDGTSNANTGVGLSTLENATTARNCVAIGNLALKENITGANNMALGAGSLQLLTAGSSNVGVGLNAGFGSSGSNNTSIGGQAYEGETTTTGSDNVSIGFKSNFSLDLDGDRNIAIGSNVSVISITGNDQINIGDTFYSDLTTITLAKDVIMQDTVDTSKELLWDLSSITTSEQREIIAPDFDFDFNNFFDSAGNAVWAGEVGFGFAKTTSDQITFRTSNFERFEITGTKFSGTLITSAAMMNEVSSYTNPTLLNRANTPTTGIGGVLHDISLICDSVEIARFDETNVTMNRPLLFTKPLINITALHTAVATNNVINCTANTFTVTLPTASGITGKEYIVKNSGAGTITVDADGTETIDGNLTVVLAADDSTTIISDGTNWIII